MKKIMIICSKAFYDQIPPIQEYLENNGWEVHLPNSYYNRSAEADSWAAGNAAHSEFKARMFRMSKERIAKLDAVVTLNFEKHGQKNYIGGATFLEIYEAFMAGLKIYLYNDIPEGMLFDELSAMDPVILHGDLTLIK